jgi:ABC-type proline/glycine betaine transport system, ATPase component
MSEQIKLKLTNDFVAEHAKDIERILRRAVKHALARHKRLGNSIATWKDGKVVIIPPEEIIISPELLESEK